MPPTAAESPEEPSLTRLVAELQERTADMVAMLDEFVSSESPSTSPRLLSRTADLVGRHGTRLLGAAPDRLERASSPVLRWRLPSTQASGRPVLLLAHLDTVWPEGTTARWPFTVDGDRASGPGAFDMKAGLVQALFALATLGATHLPRAAVVLLVTSDEELGSPSGREVVEECARDAAAVLVLEASFDGRLKTARKGVSNYDLHFTGRSAHAGLDPENGVNALLAAARAIVALDDVAAPELGTTVTATMASAGTARNTVPAAATVALDVRATTVAEQQRVDIALRSLSPPGGATVTLTGGINRPPMEADLARGLAALASRAAARCRLPIPGCAHVGGGSDGNFTAALGVPTLDGLGAVGGHAHAEGEYVVVSAMPERAALLAALLVLLGEDAR